MRYWPGGRRGVEKSVYRRLGQSSHTSGNAAWDRYGQLAAVSDESVNPIEPFSISGFRD